VLRAPRTVPQAAVTMT